MNNHYNYLVNAGIADGDCDNCAVVAFGCVLNLDYATAYNTLSRFGYHRGPGRGASLATIANALRSFGLSFNHCWHVPDCGFAVYRGHIEPIINGVFNDTSHIDGAVRAYYSIV